MRNRLLLLITLLSLMALTFACGGGAANTNTTNVARNTATNLTNTSTNVTSNTSSNTAANSTTNSNANKPTTTNTASNKPVASNSTANTAGNKVATTQKPPKGATAVCKDGTYSFSKTDSGQCSGHGGVDKKL